MTTITHVEESIYTHKPKSHMLADWRHPAERVLGTRIGFRSVEISYWNFILLKQPKTLYAAFIDLGNGEAEMVKFFPRNKSAFNYYVPETEVAAWLMGIVTGGEYVSRKNNGNI